MSSTDHRYAIEFNGEIYNFLDLRTELESLGHLFVTIDACSPDKSHCECSVAIVTSLPDLIDIAKRWEQIAIFWFDGGSFWIYGGISEADPIKLPVE